MAAKTIGVLLSLSRAFISALYYNNALKYTGLFPFVIAA